MLSASHGQSRMTSRGADLPVGDPALQLGAREADLVRTARAPAGAAAAQGRSSLLRSSVLPLPAIRGRATSWLAVSRAGADRALQRGRRPCTDRAAPLSRPIRRPCHPAPARPASTQREVCRPGVRGQRPNSRTRPLRAPFRVHRRCATRWRNGAPCIRVSAIARRAAAAGRARPRTRALTSLKTSSARSSVARSCVAMTLVRSSAPPGGTAGCSAVLTKTPGVVERPPQQAGLPVVADQDGDDRGDDVRAVRASGCGARRRAKPSSSRPSLQVARVVEHAREAARGPSSERMIRSAASAAPTAAGTAEAVNRNARDWRCAGTR